jgi:sugar phosphate isomerase/epimerase
MAFRLGAATYNYLWEGSLDDALRNIAQTGIRFVEVMTTPPHMWIGDMNSAQCAHVRRLAEERNLTLAALNPTFLDISIASTNPGIRGESVHQIRETVRVCHELGARIVVLSAGKRHPLIAPPFEHSLTLILDSLAEIVDACERWDVTIGLENGWNLVDKARQLVELVERVNSRYLKIAFDTANANVVEDVLAGLQLVRPHLVHLHLSDSTPNVRGHLPIGQGNIDFGKVGHILRDMDYHGLSILEIIHTEKSDESIRHSIQSLTSYGWEL